MASKASGNAAYGAHNWAEAQSHYENALRLLNEPALITALDAKAAAVLLRTNLAAVFLKLQQPDSAHR